MLSFKDFINEKLITFGGQAYPKFGQVVIIGGGAGSGKGFVLNNLLGIEGNVMDVDEVKKLAMKSTRLAQRIKDETGQDINNFDLRKPENVSKIHELLSDMYGITKGSQQRVFASALVADPKRKPNLIFDVTLKDMAKLESVTRNVKELGYAPENIHIVWVVNDVNVAIDQNKKRSRVVPEEILMSTHEGASLTMRKLIDVDTKVTKYMDGDIWINFNRVSVDTKTTKSDLGGSYVEKANYIKIKSKGKPPLSSKEIPKHILQKIKKYVPQTKTW